MESGYHANFCVPLDDECTCCICQGAYKEPMQSSCGHRFCKACLDNHRKCQAQRGAQFSCPIDMEEIELDQVFPDRAMERYVLSLAVKCDNMEHCDWTGDVRGLKNHMQNCPFNNLICDYCNGDYFSKDKQNHEIGCDHWPLECVNCCGAENVPRKEMALHLQTCPMAVFPCSYQYLGCTFTGTTTQMKIHLASDVDSHLRIAIFKMTTQNEDLEKKLDASVKKSEYLQKELEASVKKSEYLQKELEASVDNFSDLERRFERFVMRTYPSTVIGKALNEEIKSNNTFMIFPVKEYHQLMEPPLLSIIPKGVSSDPIYSHLGGYKLMLIANFSEYEFSLRLKVLKSEHDKTLKWPFPMNFTVYLLHPLDESKHVMKSCNTNVIRNITENERKNEKKHEIPFGCSVFTHFHSEERYLVDTFAHSYIKNEGFLINDTLYFMCKLDL